MANAPGTIQITLYFSLIHYHLAKILKKLSPLFSSPQKNIEYEIKYEDIDAQKLKLPGHFIYNPNNIDKDFANLSELRRRIVLHEIHSRDKQMDYIACLVFLEKNYRTNIPLRVYEKGVGTYLFTFERKVQNCM